MKTNLLVMLLVTALAAPGALAQDTRGKPRTGTQQQPRTQGAPQEADVKKLCEQNPLKGIAKPKVPSNEQPDVTAEIPESKVDELKFDRDCVDGAGRVQHCDSTLARAFISYYRANRAFEGELKAVCDEMKTKISECQTQAETRECAARIYKGVADKFNQVKDRLDKDAMALRLANGTHKAAAMKIYQPPTAAAATTPAPSPITGQARRQAAKSRITGEANTGGDAQLRANQAAHTSGCVGQVGHKAFCSNITAAADAAYYTVNLKKAADDTGRSAGTLNELANRTQGPGGPGDTGDNKKNGGLLDSVGGLDGLMKMATLGMMGAGMYCQMSGQCGNQASQSGLQTDPNANSGLGATSPTPSSPNNGPQQSPLESNDSKSGGSTPPSADFKTATDTDTSPSFAGPGGSGFSSEPDSEALKPFQGELNRAPATASAPTGGGLGAGNDSSGASAPPAGELNADAGKGGMGDGGLGPVGGGGGLPAAGGFSLSSSPDAPAADSALKSILNGDAPADGGLASLGDDPGTAGTPTEQGDIDLQGAESLFFRVRDTHVRCVKRGCVGREVGEKI